MNSIDGKTYCSRCNKVSELCECDDQPNPKGGDATCATLSEKSASSTVNAQPEREEHSTPKTAPSTVASEGGDRSNPCQPPDKSSADETPTPRADISEFHLRERERDEARAELESIRARLADAVRERDETVTRVQSEEARHAQQAISAAEQRDAALAKVRELSVSLSGAELSIKEANARIRELHNRVQLYETTTSLNIATIEQHTKRIAKLESELAEARGAVATASDFDSGLLLKEAARLEQTSARMEGEAKVVIAPNEEQRKDLAAIRLKIAAQTKEAARALRWVATANRISSDAATRNEQP